MDTGDKARLQAKLGALAQEISSDLAALEASEGRELLSDFVSELFLAAAERQHRQEHRQRQTQGIAAARAKGVRFGRPAVREPDNFETVHLAWREGELSLSQAARACGISRGTFYSIAARKARSEDCAG